MNVASLIELGRRLIGDTLLDAGVIADHSTTSDGKGGRVDVWTSRSDEVACRLVRERDKPLEPIAGVVSGPGTVELILPVGTDFQERDRIAIGSRVYQAVARIHADSVTATSWRFRVREV